MKSPKDWWRIWCYGLRSGSQFVQIFKALIFKSIIQCLMNNPGFFRSGKEFFPPSRRVLNLWPLKNNTHVSKTCPQDHYLFTYLELDECLIHVSTVELLESHKIEESRVSVTSPLVAFRVISTKIITCRLYIEFCFLRSVRILLWI